MKTIIMNQDIHQPAFIKADASYKTEKNRQPPSSPKQVRRFGWTRFIELAVLLSIVIGAVYLISKIVTLAVLACRHLGNPALCALRHKERYSSIHSSFWVVISI